MLTDSSWIGCSKDYGSSCPVFIKKFDLKKEIQKAVLTITAIGVYEIHINGTRVSDYVLAPGCTVFHKRLQYQTYDVTEYLDASNELAVTVGTGWYRGRISEKYGDIHDDPCAIIASLVLSYADGSEETIYTDDGWQTRASKILFSDIYDGETYDATAKDSENHEVTILKLSKEALIPQEGEMICEHERVKPISLIISPKGERIIDFGQNLAGYVEFTVTANAGEEIEFCCAEVLDKDGNFYNENYRSALAKTKYICREGEQTFKPHFTFFGFRYIRLDQYPEKFDLNDFTAIAVYSDIRRTGSINSSNAKLNRLFQNTLWSQRSNFIDLPTDCPQRDERLGWTGDAQVFAKTASYNYDVKRFFEKWMGDVRAEQNENGAVPDTVPNFWRLKGASTAWADVVCIVPWQMYLTYGDSKILRDNFDAMKKWVDYITHDTADEFLWTSPDEEKKLWRKHYGDWLALDAPAGSYMGSSDVDLIASAFYAYSTSLLIKAGNVLGKDMTEYETLYNNIVKTFKQHFRNPRTQTEHVLLLQFDLTDDRERIAADLNNMIIENGNRLQTGFVGTPYLLHVLSENGYVETAYSLLLQEENPSWLYEVNHGATTIWEHWDGINDEGAFWSRDMNSYNHYAYGAVMDWIYEKAAGIRPLEDKPGFEQIYIAPQPDSRLDWLDVSLETKYGTIRSAWTCRNGIVRYEISVPTDAVICIEGKEHVVGKGCYIF